MKKIKEKIVAIFKKKSSTELKLHNRSIRSRNRLSQQAYDYQEFVKRTMKDNLKSNDVQ